MKRWFFQLFFLVFLVSRVCSQEVDFNSYYRFPMSLGVEFQNLTPFSTGSYEYNTFDLSLNARWPIPKVPVLQPALKLGMMRFDVQDATDPNQWDHNNWYGEIGMVYSHRIDKTFELGLDLFGGYAVSIYSDLDPGGENVSYSNLVFEAGAHISLNPGYNFSIDLSPGVKYLHSLSYVEDFDGFFFRIGFGASYRFGNDPDAPGTLIRSLRIETLDIPPLFAAMQSYYVGNPFTTILLTNTDKKSVSEVKVSFNQATYMDGPTPSTTIERIEPGETIEVPLFAAFNSEIFTLEGVAPLTGEIIITYSSGSRPAKQSQSITFDLYDKKSIIWDDDRKVAAFITSQDSALRNYASFIRQSCKSGIIPAYNDSVQYGIQAFNALGVLGCLYQVDPIRPFESVQGTEVIIDSVNLPRDTLRDITGDCDDLTVLYCSLLEAVGIPTAFITVPGHIFAAFNTGEVSRNFGRIHQNREMSIALDGELWLPVEITMIGVSDFLTAWSKGAELWNSAEINGTARFYKTRDSQQIYRPVGLTETDLGLQYGNPNLILKAFTTDLDRISAGLISEFAEVARSSGLARDYNRVGIANAQFGRYRPAEEAFGKALELSPDSLSIVVNLGNLYHLQKMYDDAFSKYELAYDSLESAGRENERLGLRLLAYMARSKKLVGDEKSSEALLARITEIDPNNAEEYHNLVESSSGQTNRAAETTEKLEFLEVE